MGGCSTLLKRLSWPRPPALRQSDSSPDQVDVAWHPGDLWSEDNLSLFLDWIARSSIDNRIKKRVAEHVQITEHRGGLTQPIVLRIGNDETKLSQQQCSEENCRRCTGGQGGYKFRYISSHWTADYIVRGAEQSEEDFRRRRYEARSKPFGTYPRPAIKPGADAVLFGC